jgi:hypothetical protein
LLRKSSLKSRPAVLVLLISHTVLVAACNKPIDFTGFWKGNCTDAFGVQIKKQSGNLYSVSFCGPGGCFAPGEWTPNTTIVSDAKYRVINATTIEVRNEKGWTIHRCTTDTSPVLDYSTMGVPKSHTDDETAFAEMQREKLSAENIQKLVAQNVQDPHRPPCTTASCKTIEAFVKKNYCGESPFGEGSDDSCDLRNSKRRSTNIKVIADYDCEWNEIKNESECKQQGQVNPELRTILVHQLEELGMPAKAPGEIYFNVWQPNRADWLVAQVDYSLRAGTEIELCEVVAVIYKNSRVTVLRKLPLKKTDIDVPDVTNWTLLDIADTRGNGQLDVILEGDAYEDHWFEVISVHHDSAETIFSGLGYSL